jgi:hypothetical protein
MRRHVTTHDEQRSGLLGGQVERSVELRLAGATTEQAGYRPGLGPAGRFVGSTVWREKLLNGALELGEPGAHGVPATAATLREVQRSGELVELGLEPEPIAQAGRDLVRDAGPRVEEAPGELAAVALAASRALVALRPRLLGRAVAALAQ